MGRLRGQTYIIHESLDLIIGQDRTGHFIHLIVMYMNSKNDLKFFQKNH